MEEPAMIPVRKFWLVIFALALGSILAAQAEAAKKELTNQEKYVLEQVAAGRAADMKARFGNKEEDRILSASFLEDLLTGTYKVNRKGIEIANAVITEPLDLVDAHVMHKIGLVKCWFKEPVFFRDAIFDKHLAINGSHFDKSASFDGIKVKENFVCINSIFQGPVDFLLAYIGGQFVAIGAQFNDKQKGADFTALKVKNAAFFIESTFLGPVDFKEADISGQFNAIGARFLSKEQTVNFNPFKVSRSALFNNATFQGPVSFATADIGGQFNANEARFLSQEKLATFNSMKVKGHTSFVNATFQGPVDFRHAEIGGQFNGHGVKFLNDKHAPNFEGMRVSHYTQFINVTFCSTVILKFCNFSDLFIQGTNLQKEDGVRSFVSLDMQETVIKRQLDIKNFNLEALEAKYLQVDGRATFEKLVIKEFADFQNANIKALEFKNVTWPEEKTNLKLDGLSYTSLFVDEPDNFLGLLGLVKNGDFNPQNYLELEEYCKRAGHQDWANKVFIAGKRREIKETWNWWNYWKWPSEKVLLDWGVGYGRHPKRAIYFSGLFLLLGWYVFSRPGVLTRKNKENDARIGPSQVFWFSFDAFMPLVSLGPDQLYKVDRERRLKLSRFLPQMSAQTYFYLHQLAGYILVTIGVAAVTGIIK